MSTPFHARVIAARLGAEGMLTQIRGNLGGPCPIGDVSVWVSEDDASAAAELLLADEIEAVFTPHPDDEEPVPSRRPVLFGCTRQQLLAGCTLVLVLFATMLSRFLG